MAKLAVFNTVSIDGYICDASGDMQWAHNRAPDPEWDAFVRGNAGGKGMLVFGRVTYDMMNAFWPTPMAEQMMPEVAAGMNAMPKLVFSRSMTVPSWQNTTLASGDLVDEIRHRKAGSLDMAILGSGSIVAQLAAAGLIDEYQIAVFPVALGSGKTMFDGISAKVALKRTLAREFANGNLLTYYVPA